LHLRQHSIIIVRVQPSFASATDVYKARARVSASFVVVACRSHTHTSSMVTHKHFREASTFTSKHMIYAPVLVLVPCCSPSLLQFSFVSFARAHAAVCFKLGSSRFGSIQ
jgi:hypothetical protein